MRLPQIPRILTPVNKAIARLFLRRRPPEESVKDGESVRETIKKGGIHIC